MTYGRNYDHPASRHCQTVNVYAEQEAYDRLPARLREVIRNVPVVCQCSDLEQALATFSVDQVIGFVKATVPDFTVQSASKKWAKSHPYRNLKFVTDHVSFVDPPAGKGAIRA